MIYILDIQNEYAKIWEFNRAWDWKLPMFKSNARSSKNFNEFFFPWETQFSRK